MISVYLAMHLERPALLLVFGLSLFAVLGALRVLATWVEQEREIHDLRVRSLELRQRVLRRMAQREGLIDYDDADVGEVEVLEDDDPAAADAVELREMPPAIPRAAPKPAKKSAAPAPKPPSASVEHTPPATSQAA